VRERTRTEEEGLALGGDGGSIAGGEVAVVRRAAAAQEAKYCTSSGESFALVWLLGLRLEKVASLIDGLGP
jgi:hypothetical protein